MKYLIRLRNQSHFEELSSISLLTSLFLSVFLDARTTRSQAIQLTGMVGGSVVFPFKVPPWVPVETIVWNSVTTLATFTPRKGKPAAVKVLDKRYIGRLRVLDHTYSLVISNLSVLDRGIYRAQINTEFTTTVTEYLLRVYKRVSVPDIQMVSKTLGNESCTMNLSCTVKSGDNVTYSWNCSKGNTSQHPYNDNFLHLFFTPGEGSFSCKCTARNKISVRCSPSSVASLCRSVTPAGAWQASCKTRAKQQRVEQLQAFGTRLGSVRIRHVGPHFKSACKRVLSPPGCPLVPRHGVTGDFASPVLLPLPWPHGQFQTVSSFDFPSGSSRARPSCQVM
uniref:Ig-like domain-containing protein n=1 Tax=Chrysemys picta bellii TaxID=8478 RepID=A0A8C3IVM5_CHRPI